MLGRACQSPAPKPGCDFLSVNGKAIARAMSSFGGRAEKSLLSLSLSSVLLEQQGSTCRCAEGRLALQRQVPKSHQPMGLQTLAYSLFFFQVRVKHPTELSGIIIQGQHIPAPSPGSTGSPSVAPPQGVQLTHSAREIPIFHICKGSEIASFSRALRALCSVNTQNPVLAVQPAITVKPKIAARQCQHHSSPRHVPRLSPPGCGDGRQ